MKKGKLLIFSLVLLLLMGGVVSAQKGEKARKDKEKAERKMVKVRIKGLERLKDLDTRLDGLAERLECLKDFKVDIDMSGLYESLKCLENLKNLKVHVCGLEALDVLADLDIDIDIPEFDFDFDFDNWFDCEKRSKAVKIKKLSKSPKKAKKKK